MCACVQRGYLYVFIGIFICLWVVFQEWLWSKAKFEARKLAIDELNEQFLSDGKLPSLKNDNLFCEKANLDVYLGRFVAFSSRKKKITRRVNAQMTHIGHNYQMPL